MGQTTVGSPRLHKSVASSVDDGELRHGGTVALAANLVLVDDPDNTTSVANIQLIAIWQNSQPVGTRDIVLIGTVRLEESNEAGNNGSLALFLQVDHMDPVIHSIREIVGAIEDHALINAGGVLGTRASKGQKEEKTVIKDHLVYVQNEGTEDGYEQEAEKSFEQYLFFETRLHPQLHLI
ncbi:uncharacterized protein N7458_007498 [Penicillium daleae]|uniref:Uncharacterized protein n=1 Tax=Penicillium daleae TaxID=63821 RepID=A0AAD6C168_9EURO|nr:uncharacterized protein N7458_007498 [Penicillium daleae]KAJ5443626.1 hypothetical protein N7458_007498 [Penicillium daleae]